MDHCLLGSVALGSLSSGALCAGNQEVKTTRWRGLGERGEEEKGERRKKKLVPGPLCRETILFLPKPSPIWTPGRCANKKCHLFWVRTKQAVSESLWDVRAGKDVVHLSHKGQGQHLPPGSREVSFHLPGSFPRSRVLPHSGLHPPELRRREGREAGSGRGCIKESYIRSF